MNDEAIDQAVEVLNRALSADPKAMSDLVLSRVPCNLDLADDPTIQCGSPGDDEANGYEVGLLGVINGILGRRPTGGGYVGAVLESDHRTIVEFRRMDR